MQKEEREQELAYFDQTEQKIKEQVKALRTVIEEGNKKIKEQKQFVWDNTADMDEEELLENVIDLLEYQHKKEQMQKRIKKQDELVREVKRNHRISGEETLRKEIPGLERASFREGKIEEKIEGKVEILYEELHMTVAEIAEKLVISEEEVQKIVDASK